MSATGRGSARRDADFYPTPAWCVHRLLDAVEFPTTGTWIEPCAGDGAIIRAVEDHVGERLDWLATEIRESCRPALLALTPAVTTGDYLAVPVSPPTPPSVLITNPPYLLAPEFIAAALRHAQWVAMLLRVNFLASESRADFLRREAPDVYVLPNRPEFMRSVKCRRETCRWRESFALDAPWPKSCPACNERTESCSSDATEYAWFVWTPERGRTRGSVQVLADTPAHVRKRIPASAQASLFGGAM